jgi:SAM-dependent methyltransferase
VVARTLESFGYEWNAFADVRSEDETYWARYFADVSLGELENRVGLDAGCGKGRYTRHLAPHLRSVVALDASTAVVAAARNLAPLPNVAVVRADLRSAPFADASFGFISSLGVLHHLPDPREGFRGLCRLLAPDGLFLLYVYSAAETRGSRATGLAAARALRRVTVHVPHPLLRRLSAPLAAVLYACVVLPGQVGRRLRWSWLERLPLSVYRGQPWRGLWLDTFDRLSAPIEFRYRWSELQSWFEEEGLRVDAVREDAGLYVVARKKGGSNG